MNISCAYDSNLNYIIIIWKTCIEIFPCEVPELNKSHLISDYILASQNCAIEKSIYMEVDVAPQLREKEREIIQNLCADENIITEAAVYGASPGTPDFKMTLKALLATNHTKGARLVLHPPETKSGTCLSNDFISDIQLLGQKNLLFDVCIRPAELSDVTELALKCPDTTLILDHCGNADPNIVSGQSNISVTTTYQHTRKQWLADIERLGVLNNVICKISGIIARAKPNWTSKDLSPTVNHCIDCFGEDKVIFGSDWPVCTLSTSLSEWVTALRTIISSRTVKLQKKLLYENALRIYSIK